MWSVHTVQFHQGFAPALCALMMHALQQPACNPIKGSDSYIEGFGAPRVAPGNRALPLEGGFLEQHLLG